MQVMIEEEDCGRCGCGRRYECFNGDVRPRSQLENGKRSTGRGCFDDQTIGDERYRAFQV